MSTPTLREATQQAMQKLEASERATNERASKYLVGEALELLRAALTQAADAGAAEPVATIEALQARIAALEAELDDMEAERDEALRGPWTEWAERMKTTIRKYSGYDGVDDASEGIDLPAELDELMEHAVEPSAQQLQQAVARALDKAADFICSGPPPVKVEGGHIEIGKRARRAYAAAIRQQGKAP